MVVRVKTGHPLDLLHSELFCPSSSVRRSVTADETPLMNPYFRLKA
jgi:hypothetical protein